MDECVDFTVKLMKGEIAKGVEKGYSSEEFTKVPKHLIFDIQNQFTEIYVVLLKDALLNPAFFSITATNPKNNHGA